MWFRIWLALIFLSPVLQGAEYKWEKLEGCTLETGAYKDGDSFHVLHDGKNYIIRLYFVDTPEDDDRFPDRVAEQAAYFGVPHERAIKLGVIAAEFSTEILGAKPFTVWTLWQDAMGASNQPRFYGYVVTDKGPLCELLVKAGLARVYGKRIELPGGEDSRTYLQKLEGLEAIAKQGELGGWGTSDTVPDASSIKSATPSRSGDRQDATPDIPAF